MSNLFCSSIGKKLLMSLSGLFLITFLVIHLAVNSLLLLCDGGDTFNAAAHFMGTNPLIRIMEPILGLGFFVHILYGSLITAQNNKARGSDKYSSGNKTTDVMWASKNMWVLGLTIFAFLVVHVWQFWVKMKITGDPLLAETVIDIAGVKTQVVNAYALVNATFSQLWVVIFYVLGSLGLALHLTHGFWSAFQTLGASNNIWRKRLTIIGIIFAWAVGIGFSIIAVGQFLFFQS
ncbi:succinate dehydrogenase / fumarate reductase cytochrome b subunit [Saccharicrinis carchari]|uniref:Succinate dehydrogenase / fumarate reductase cytochrome b subunit n=1 Tax=Saccharicrinis carchari TaxID=1168039 RepID=A0A521CSN4_SACCC|nr:succinate dehydrogenase cytochrome b subunit [Saccharicrinis carchari]SMO62484.1 succinate dehydrogenase / fumarate reductase cytochrome b subunit [Saccharicrinis carchari]